MRAYLVFLLLLVLGAVVAVAALAIAANGGDSAGQGERPAGAGESRRDRGDQAERPAGPGESRGNQGEQGERPAGAYTIGFWGDVPYSPEQQTTGVGNLVEDMNRERLAFSVHAGDIKSGSTRCDNEVYAQTEGYLNALEAPAMLTPGDNEWTDCDRPEAGAYDSEERLTHIRTTMFDTPASFGQRGMPLESQAPPGAPYTENRRWQVGPVVYATLHLAGSNNNLGDPAPDPAEWAARDRATNQWLRESFEVAKRTGAAGVLLVAQANPGFDRSDPTRAPARDPQTLVGDAGANGYDNFVRALRDETVGFRRPVVLVHGDTHYFRLDKPLLDAQGRRVENFTRLETPGDSPQHANNDVHWVKLEVEPASRELFSFEPQVVPGNRVAVPAP